MPRTNNVQSISLDEKKSGYANNVYNFHKPFEANSYEFQLRFPFKLKGLEEIALSMTRFLHLNDLLVAIQSCH